MQLTEDELQEALFAASHALLAAEPLEPALDRFWELAHESDRREAARDTRLSAPDALTSAAAWYAGQGIAVFLISPRDKRPLLPAAHPPDEQTTCRGECGRTGHGLYDATTDLATVRTWWARYPQANIGLPTGGRFDVIDVDGPAGYQSVADLRESGHLPDIIGRAYTPSGGRHLYVAPTGDGNATKFRPGLDYRGAGGYVVAPPSVGRNGKRYDWINPLVLPAAR
jgi:hypothetical protein